MPDIWYCMRLYVLLFLALFSSNTLFSNQYVFLSFEEDENAWNKALDILVRLSISFGGTAAEILITMRNQEDKARVTAFFQEINMALPEGF